MTGAEVQARRKFLLFFFPKIRGGVRGRGGGTPTETKTWMVWMKMPAPGQRWRENQAGGSCRQRSMRTDMLVVTGTTIKKRAVAFPDAVTRMRAPSPAKKSRKHITQACFRNVSFMLCRNLDSSARSLKASGDCGNKSRCDDRRGPVGARGLTAASRTRRHEPVVVSTWGSISGKGGVVLQGEGVGENLHKYALRKPLSPQLETLRHPTPFPGPRFLTFSSCTTVSTMYNDRVCRPSTTITAIFNDSVHPPSLDIGCSDHL